MNLETCTRCESKIVEENFSHRPRYFEITRQIEGGKYESYTVQLCSMCWEELYQWALGDDTPDRSDMADPLPIERMADGVEQHIGDLEGILSELEAATER